MELGLEIFQGLERLGLLRHDRFHLLGAAILGLGDCRSQCCFVVLLKSREERLVLGLDLGHRLRYLLLHVGGKVPRRLLEAIGAFPLSGEIGAQILLLAREGVQLPTQLLERSRRLYLESLEGSGGLLGERELLGEDVTLLPDGLNLLVCTLRRCLHRVAARARCREVGLQRVDLGAEGLFTRLQRGPGSTGSLLGRTSSCGLKLGQRDSVRVLGGPQRLLCIPELRCGARELRVGGGERSILLASQRCRRGNGVVPREHLRFRARQIARERILRSGQVGDGVFALREGGVARLFQRL